MTPSLPRSTPSAQGVDAAGIEALLDAIEADPSAELHSLMVARHGHVVAEGWWHPYSRDRVHLLYSLSKSFTSAAAGFAAAEGLLDVDASVLSYFPELDDRVTDPRSRAMKVRHVAAMASGHLAETIDEAFTNPDPILGFLTIPPDRDPGTVFAYNQPCTYSLGAIVQRRSGGTLVEYLTPRLLAPLGITHAAWQQRQVGVDLAFSGLHLTTEDIARFGQTLLDGGRWQGEQLLPAGWVEEASRVHVSTVGGTDPDGWGPDGPDWAQGYGWQFWRSRHGYRGDGAYGQYCLVLPDEDVVVATTAAANDMQAVLDAVWTHLLPALDSGRDADPAAEHRLAERLAVLALPVVPAGDLPLGPDPLTLTDTDRSLRGIGRLTLRPGADGGHVLDVETWDGALTAAVGVGAWAVTEPDGDLAPVAVCAGRPGDGAGRPGGGDVVLDLALLETPHRLRVTWNAASGEGSAAWHTEPLGGISLRTMRRPLPAVTSA